VIASLKSMAIRIDAQSVDGNHRSLIIRIMNGEDEPMDLDGATVSQIEGEDANG